MRSARTESQKLYICVEQNGRHAFADAELDSELAKTHFSGQAPGAAGVSLIYMEMYPYLTSTNQAAKQVSSTKAVLETTHFTP